MKEKYILLEDVENLGNAGDLVAVLPGYARNFLIPKKLALKASKGALRQFEARRGKIEEKRKAEIERLKQVASNIAQLKISISMNVGEDNKLYGSVTSYTVAQAIADKGIQLDHNKLVMPSAIKELGDYEVKIKLHPEVISALTISVVKA